MKYRKLACQLTLPVWSALLIFLSHGTAAQAGVFSYRGSTDKNPLTYAPGEKMVFTIQLLEDGKPAGGKNLSWNRRGDDGKSKEGTAVSSADQPLIIITSIEQPGFVHIHVSARDSQGMRLIEDGKPLMDFDGGAVAAIDKLEGWPEPDDFDAFWARQKTRLAAVPLRAELVTVKSDDREVLTFDVKVDCAGKMPVSGYYCKPKNARPKSLPARVTFHGYGVDSADKPTRSGKTSLAFDINAHGILNGQPPEYDKNLQRTTLQTYAFKEAENQNPETAYFNGMFLRVIRALDFIKSQPEWDGSTIIVSGTSQGGLQCLAAAGLDADVTRCDAKVPWCCDLGGRNRNRLSGWFPKWTDALGYYDAANHANRIKCPTSIYAGLGDYTSPPSSVTVLYHNLKAPKQLIFQQGRSHLAPRQDYGDQFTLTQAWSEPD